MLRALLDAAQSAEGEDLPLGGDNPSSEEEAERHPDATIGHDRSPLGSSSLLDGRPTPATMPFRPNVG